MGRRRCKPAHKPQSRTSRATPPPVGPYDLTTTRLPFGTELEALGEGFSRERSMKGGYTAGKRDGRIIGYTKAATRANTHVLADTHAAWILADSWTGLLRAQTAAQLFEGESKTEMFQHFNEEGPGGTVTPTAFSLGVSPGKESSASRIASP